MQVSIQMCNIARMNFSFACLELFKHLLIKMALGSRESSSNCSMWLNVNRPTDALHAINTHVPRGLRTRHATRQAGQGRFSNASQTHLWTMNKDDEQRRRKTR